MQRRPLGHSAPVRRLQVRPARRGLHRLGHWYVHTVPVSSAFMYSISLLMHTVNAMSIKLSILHELKVFSLINDKRTHT